MDSGYGLDILPQNTEELEQTTFVSIKLKWLTECVNNMIVL